MDGMSVEELRAEVEALKAQLKSSDKAKRAESLRLYQEFRKKHGGAYEPPGTDPEPECPELPNDGRPQPEKNANKDPNTWKVASMQEDPSLFKVVDDTNTNVADQFHSKATAEQYISHFSCDVTEPEPCPAGQHRDAAGNCVPDLLANGQIGPYPSTGKEIQTTQKGPTTRHYRSGKPDDETVERNAKKEEDRGIEFDNYQFIVETTVNEIEHDDTISLKFGGTHKGGWFDCGVSFKEGECCLGTEEKHPSTDLCIVRGPKIGSILKKRVKIAGVYFKKRNHVELWTNLGDGWKKQVEGDDVGGFNPNLKVNEVQERIDGFKKRSVPELHMAIVQEIAG